MAKPANPRPRLAPWSPTASREEIRAYLQERMALLSKLLFWIFWVLVGFVFGLYEVYPEVRPEKVDIVHLFAIGGLLLLAGMWYGLLYRRESSIETLYKLDFIYALLVGITFGLSIYFSSDQTANIYSALIWHTFMIFARALVVPSTGRRTFVVSALSFVPLYVGAAGVAAVYPWRLDVPPAAFLTGSVLFSAVAVLLATTGSRVIYGLRRQVREAVQLGQYTLVDKIGEGGMGAVYLARHAMLRRPTAIKLLPMERYGADSVARFEREVQHTSQLSHPNTVAIFDYGRSPDGVFYYAMEYLDGIDLERLVTRYGPQPLDRIVHIIRQVCGALAEAHDRKLIHRDIKPANILLCQRGGATDVAKVVDFGLVTDGDASGEASAVQGTPAYVSPEAVTDPASIEARSDLYSLGAVAYYLITGKRVFDGATGVELCVKHASQTPVPPSARGDREVPADLEAIIMACLAKSPDDRPASASDLRDQLGALAATGDWSEAQAEEWWRGFEDERNAAAVPRVPSPLTMTVDLGTRAPDPLADTMVSGADTVQDRETGQAR